MLSIKLDQCNIRIGCGDCNLRSRHSVGSARIRCSIIKHKVIDVTTESIACSWRTRRTTDNNVIKSNISSALITNLLITTNEDLITIQTQRLLTFLDSNVDPCTSSKGIPVSCSNRRSNLSAIQIKDNLLIVRIGAVTLNSCSDRVSISGIVNMQQGRLMSSAPYSCIHGHPHSATPFNRSQTQISNGDRCNVVKLQRSSAKLIDSGIMSNINLTEVIVGAKLLLSGVLYRICTVAHSPGNELIRLLTVNSKNSITRVIQSMGVCLETNTCSIINFCLMQQSAVILHIRDN